jgi:hypothetical protein
MHRRTLFPFLILLAALLLGASPSAAIPPPPEASEARALLSAPAPIALTDFDVRFHALAVDAAGQVFVAVPYPGSRVRICRLAGGRLEPFYDLPGSKHASVDLEILPSGSLLVSWSSRPDGAADGPFPLMMQELPGVAVPSRRAEDVLGAAINDPQSPLGRMVWARAVRAARAVVDSR